MYWNKLVRLIFISLLLMASHLQAAEWQLLGTSEAGQHFIDRATVMWDQDKTAFSIKTNVIQKDGAEWLITLKVDCKAESFSYLDGRESKNDAVIAQFDIARPPEKIQPQSMPYQLSEEYCATLKPQRAKDWQKVGSSKVSNVFFDRASVRKNKQGSRFKADTKVIPFDQNEATYSTLAFDCKERSFTVLKMSKLKNDQLEHIFDKPQPPTSIDKTATLVNLANRFCTPQKDCEQVSARLKSIESRIQANYENGDLSCKEVDSSIAQVLALDKEVKKYNCRITRLDDYIQQLKQANCR